MPSLSDLSHKDPCVLCHDIVTRADMVTAAKHFKKTGKRGYVCKPCHANPYRFMSARAQAALRK